MRKLVILPLWLVHDNFISPIFLSKITVIILVPFLIIVSIDFGRTTDVVLFEVDYLRILSCLYFLSFDLGEPLPDNYYSLFVHYRPFRLLFGFWDVGGGLGVNF